MSEKKNLTILIVDDDAQARDTIGELLELDGYNVTTAQSGMAALEILAHASFDIIISDLLMNSMDGIELTKNIKTLGIDIPIIVMTGFATIERAVESMKAGASDFINKPFNKNQIKLIIEKTIEKRRLQELADEREFYKKLSRSDELTDLANYRCFKDVLEKEFERAERYKRPLSLLMIDIDDFKTCNDSYGHLTGDIVLKQISVLIKKNIRGCDLAARYGGEEFTVILPETAEDETIVVAERIRDSVAQYKFETSYGKPIHRISVTLGIAAYPQNAQNPKDLLDTADSALYEGKRAGKNCVVIYGKGIQKPIFS